MLNIRNIAYGFFAVNLFAIFFLVTREFHKSSQAPNVSFVAQTQSGPLLFHDPQLAYTTLKKLDVFSEAEPRTTEGYTYNSFADGFSADHGYCEKHRAYFVNNPEFIFQEKLHFITNYYTGTALRKRIIPALGINVHPNLKPRGKPKKKPSRSIFINQRVDAHVYWMWNSFFIKRKLGAQFSCLTQASNHIPGHGKIYRKDMAAQSLVDYVRQYSSRPTCFNTDKHFPKNWVLRDKEQCLDFFKEFNSPKYTKLKKERNVVYFRKIGANAHQGSGVFPVQGKEEEHLRKLYDGGKLCGTIDKNYLINYNVWNTLLVEKRKPGFRMFMLVASTNPLIAYYHDGYVRLSIEEFDQGSDKTRTFVTNINLSSKELSQIPILTKMTKQEIEEYTSLTLEDFGNYLNRNKIINDPNWVENYLRPQFKKALTHLLRMTQTGFTKTSSVFELYGIDFVMDSNLGIWYIETNAKPLLDRFTPRIKLVVHHMLMDTFDIIINLIRSRTKRIINYVNTITQAGVSLTDQELEKRRLEFKEISKNRFEPEYLPRANNTFHPIIDENKVGVDRYYGLIEEKCL